jgi:glycosyltransferase involved in cell wall biosynthesis
MKFLFVDKYYFIKGGAERYFFEFADVLEKKGHEIIPFSMSHSENFSTAYSKYFVSEIEYNGKSSLKKLLNAPSSLFRMIYSLEAKKQLTNLIEETKPDIAHLHMIDHQISPSILHVLKKYDIPVMQTVHQYKLVCPNYRFYNARKNMICEKCLDRKYYHPIFEKCHKNSSITGAMLALEMTIHKKMKIYENNIDLFHVPSTFMGEKLIQGGIDPEKIFQKFYTINLDEFPYQKDFENYFVYFGRLSEEKGILTLLKAMKGISGTKLLILGSGPEEDRLKKYADENNLNDVEFLGYKGKEDINEIIGKAKFVVVPSEWYDNSPLVIYESFALGTPVIGANLGGIPELVNHEINGLIFEAGNVEDLTEKIKRLVENSDLAKKFSQAARNKAETEFHPEFHYEAMMEKYKGML